jgi:hypothetical protein
MITELTFPNKPLMTAVAKPVSARDAPKTLQSETKIET